MGFWGRLFWHEKRSAPPPSPAMVQASSGFSISELRQNSTVTACVNVVCNAIAILPLNLYFRSNDGSRVKAYSNPLYKLVKYSPNPSESPTLFFSRLVRSIKEKGNAFVFVARKRGDVAGLYLLPADKVLVKYAGLVPSYHYGSEVYDSSQVIHIPSLIVDDRGYGYADVDLARAAVLLSRQFDSYALSSFGNGLNTKLLIDIAEMTANISDINEAQKLAQTVADYVHRNYTGVENVGKPFISWSGMKPSEIKGQSSNREAELLESRKWSELEVCKILGVPPFLVNGSYDVKYGNLESAMTVFLNFGLTPLLRHIEQRMAAGLLDAYDRERYYFEFDYHVLLRPDEKSRAEFYSKLFNMGAMSPGQIAARENLEPPPEAADVRFVPANMMPLTEENMAAYMAKSKLIIDKMFSGEPTPDPARAAGDDKL